MQGTRPKFVLGELVAVFSKESPRYNCGRTEITFRRWMTAENSDSGYVGWVYRTAHIEGVADPNSIFYESSLRKLPEHRKLQWKHCPWQPDEVKKDG